MNIVLVHGILGFRNLVELGTVGLIPYFRGVADHFRAQGHNVLAVELDKTAGVVVRAGQLREQISAGLASGGPLDRALKTHLIAHSMGGLDSRYLLSPANPAPNDLAIRSLTTIGTPHFGSPVADAVDNPNTPAPVRAAIAAVLAKFGISLDGLRDLKTDCCRTFSATYGNRPGVDYFCIAGTGRGGFVPTWALFVPLHAYLQSQSGEANDGLVTRSSAQWGTSVGDWAADHVDEIGYNLPVVIPPAFHHLPKYDEILVRITGLE
jgi:triacylglycerol lipase